MQPLRQLSFRPHPFFRGGHAQTLAGFYWPASTPSYTATAIPVPVSDGDQIVLHDDQPSSWNATDGVALLLHGLAGCHGSGYMVRISAKLCDRGIRTFRMDMRGVGAATGLADLPGHAGRTADAAAAVERIATICPEAPLTIVGFSMGANVVLGTLADASTREIGNLVRGIAVAPPVDLSACCHELQTGVGQLYDQYLIRLLVRRWREAGGKINGTTPQTIFQFDDTITAPLSGYRDAEDYYAHASSGPRLNEIKLPTRILAARDDPVVSFRTIEESPRSPHVELLVTDSGGHLGFLGRRRDVPDRRWLDQQIVKWICDW